MRRRNYSGYRLTNRSETLARLAAQGITAQHENTILEHVTHQYPDSQCAPPATHGEIVGHANGDGIQALLVEIDGTSDRPQGGHYHLTLSVGEGHAPKESNALLTDAIENDTLEELVPIPLELEPF